MNAGDIIPKSSDSNADITKPLDANADIPKSLDADANADIILKSLDVDADTDIIPKSLDAYADIIDLNHSKKFKYIVHLADIHIPNNINRHSEYSEVFKKLYVDIKIKSKLKRKNTCIVIAGDIFHDARKEGKLSPNAIVMFKQFIQNLKKLGTIVIIPGNHDNNITYQNSNINTKKDAISCVLTDIKGLNINIFYLKDTNKYKLGNIMLYHTSVFDIDKISNSSDYNKRLEYLIKRTSDHNDCKHVGVLHCGIDSQRIHNGYVLRDCAFKISDIENYDICCLGDTHHHQFLGEKNNIGYPNSLLQQNHGESINNHGYILWNLKTNTGILQEIQNDYGFITIDSNDTIGNIAFPKKSRIKLIYSDDIDIDNIKKIINQKTDIISWKEKREWNSNEGIDTSTDRDLNDNNKIIEYINKKYTNHIKREKILNKLTKDLNYHEKNNGRLSCEILELKLVNFQCYKGNHTIDFTKYKQNSTISISGNNASGKSTIIRALIFGIWGPSKGSTINNINNQSETCNVIIKFQQNDIIYKISRNINKKGTQNLKFEKYDEHIWTNESLKYITKTQVKIESFFGTKADAKQTWLSEQGVDNSFINAKDSYLTFQHFIGADIYELIFENVEKEKKELEKRITEKKRSIPINNIDHHIQHVMENLQLEKYNTKTLLKKFKLDLVNEHQKKIYGSKEDYTNWTTEIIQLNKSNSDLENKLNKKLKKNILTSTIKDINSKISLLNINKDLLLTQLPTNLPKNTYKYNIGDILKELLDINNKLVDSDTTNIEQIKFNLEAQTKKETIFLELTNKLNINTKKYQKLSKNIDDSLYKYKIKELLEINAEITINDAKLHNFILDSLNIKLLNKNKKQFSKKIVKFTAKIKLNNAYLKTEHTKLIDLPEQDDIDKNYLVFMNYKKLLKKEHITLTIAQNKLDISQTNLDKYNALQFDNKCVCCTNNKLHFKIDEIEQSNTNYLTNVKAILKNIDTFQKYHDDYSIYLKYHDDSIINQQTIKKIELLNMELSNYRLQLDNFKNKINTIENTITDYNKHLAIFQNKEILITTRNNITEYIEKTKYEINTLNELENENDTIRTRLSTINYSKNNINNLQIKYNELLHIKQLNIRKNELLDIQHNIKLLELTNSLNDDISQIKREIHTLKQNKINLENEFDNNSKIILNIDTINKQLTKLNMKISLYQTKGGYDTLIYNNINKQISDLENKNELLTSKIAQNELKLNEYNSNITLTNKINFEMIELNDQLEFIKDYCSIIDPRFGYPNQLIISNLKIFENYINSFVKSSNFEFITNIYPPVYKPNSKRQSQKLIFTHKKNDKEFSQLSGAETFIFNIAIQTTLGNLLNTTKPPLQCIDEGFSSLDDKHICEIPVILNQIKSRFNLILYISHNESIKNKGDYNIKVTKNNNSSLLHMNYE